jgi:hypothetical protein
VAADGASLTVAIPAGLVAQPDTLRVAVMNGGPGGGTSNLQPLFVTQASTTVTSSSTSTSGTATTGGAGPNTAGSVTLNATGGSGVTGQQLSFSVSATNPEPDDTVSLAASGLPDGLVIGPTTFDQASGTWVATVSGRVTAPAGTYTASFTANDGYSTSAAQTVSIGIKSAEAGNLFVLSQDSASCHLLLNRGANVSVAGTAAVNGTSNSALCVNSARLSATTITVQGGVQLTSAYDCAMSCVASSRPCRVHYTLRG